MSAGRAKCDMSTHCSNIRYYMIKSALIRVCSKKRYIARIAILSDLRISNKYLSKLHMSPKMDKNYNSRANYRRSVVVYGDA